MVQFLNDLRIRMHATVRVALVKQFRCIKKIILIATVVVFPPCLEYRQDCSSKTDLFIIPGKR